MSRPSISIQLQRLMLGFQHIHPLCHLYSLHLDLDFFRERESNFIV